MNGYTVDSVEEFKKELAVSPALAKQLCVRKRKGPMLPDGVTLRPPENGAAYRDEQMLVLRKLYVGARIVEALEGTRYGPKKTKLYELFRKNRCTIVGIDGLSLEERAIFDAMLLSSGDSQATVSVVSPSYARDTEGNTFFAVIL